MYVVQIDFILRMNIKVLFFSFLPLTPHGRAYSQGLLFRPDKQFFCLLQLLPEDCFQCDWIVNEDAGRRGGRASQEGIQTKRQNTLVLLQVMIYQQPFPCTYGVYGKK